MDQRKENAGVTEDQLNERLMELREELDTYFTEFLIIGYRRVPESEQVLDKDTNRELDKNQIEPDTNDRESDKNNIEPRFIKETEVPHCFIPGRLIGAGGLLKWALHNVKEKILQNMSR